MTDADSAEPVWREVGPPPSEDSEPATPDAEDLALFKRCRVAYGILN